jgi:TetR/AcrR family transcriptional regulator, transcriptional repressor for nem operon
MQTGGRAEEGERVARYGKEHKEATRQRIVEAAGRRFKQDGIDGSGIATLMADAGLTNGAFYAHFASKDDLVASVVAHELASQAAKVDQLAAGRAGLEAYVRAYLSAEHRDSAPDGCPAAALLDELGRCSLPAKRAFADGAETILVAIAERLDPRNPSAARGTAVALYALLVGTLQLSRAVPDRRVADEILDQGLESARGLLGSDKRVRRRS